MYTNPRLLQHELGVAYRDFQAQHTCLNAAKGAVNVPQLLEDTNLCLLRD